MKDAEAFWHPPSLEELVEAQGVQHAVSPVLSPGDFWEDDDVDDFIEALRRWRREQ